MYGVLANIIFVIHILIIVFMVGGALLPTKWKTKKIEVNNDAEKKEAEQKVAMLWNIGKVITSERGE